MTVLRIYRVKITQCSLNFMWYKNHIGEEFDCEVVKNVDTLFASYTDESWSYRAIKPILTETKRTTQIIEVCGGFMKLIRLDKPQIEFVSVDGWILSEDVDVLNMNEYFYDNEENKSI
jgi:hypothetical protein